MNKVFADLPVTVFEAMSQAARDNNAINLGQGFPDDPGPEDIRRAAADATVNGYNQYPSMMGIPELRQAIAPPLHNQMPLNLCHANIAAFCRSCRMSFFTSGM